MKKKLEAELISIAHRILKLKNKDDIHQLHHETQKLYEKLSVLLFVEENFGEVKPTIGIHEIEEKLERAFDFDEKIVVAELKNDEIIEVQQQNTAETVQETTTTPEVAVLPEIQTEETPLFTLDTEKEDDIIPVVEAEKELPKAPKTQITLDDILGNIQAEPIFERVSESTTVPPEKANTKEASEEYEQPKAKIELDFFAPPKEVIFEKAIGEKPSTNLNDVLNKGINITLNDRIAFEKNLFDGSTEDLNRVISQLSTFGSFQDAKNFIEEMVKPDYNNWEGKEEFEDRFMEFVESKFI
ncbi:hypothetical protein [Flavobacterium luminosum]|uniref:Uncharacterized protein n=1 Tax=Flavobacterium luminosum TaxID=2949086 RepID=A0ABT0TQ18_9FLAO|nr:hypothetical protein [Flavobacterium sp. HXWNR70]MCL9809485.1 hypothetical protein [Flavobacterium sp. HXWNR70]